VGSLSSSWAHFGQVEQIPGRSLSTFRGVQQVLDALFQEFPHIITLLVRKLANGIVSERDFPKPFSFGAPHPYFYRGHRREIRPIEQGARNTHMRASSSECRKCSRDRIEGRNIYEVCIRDISRECSVV